METITIQELGAYLGSGLKFISFDDDRKPVIQTIKRLSFYKDQLVIESSEGWDLGLREIKPIVRPLSDLTKEIEHNGERFVPVERLSFSYLDFTIMQFKIDKTRVSYSDIQKLIEWHFDINNWIERDLAIDLNTTNK